MEGKKELLDNIRNFIGAIKYNGIEPARKDAFGNKWVGKKMVDKGILAYKRHDRLKVTFTLRGIDQISKMLHQIEKNDRYRVERWTANLGEADSLIELEISD